MRDPSKEFKRMRKQLNGLFERFECDFPKITAQKIRQPLVDVLETENHVVIAAELPGIDKDDIIFSVKGNKLEIEAQKRSEKEIKRKGFYKQERSYKGFKRLLTLPCTVDAANAKSEYKQGVLRIIIPKSKKKLKVKKRIELR